MTTLRTLGLLVATLSVTAACTLRLDNAAPAQQLAQAAQAPGSRYDGWRVFNQRCAACHGKDVAGDAPMPDLLERVSQMGPRRFANEVLNRYDWSQAIAVDDDQMPIPRLYLRRRPGHDEEILEMPAWADNPAVVGHVADLYAYLSARADGRIGTGAPPR